MTLKVYAPLERSKKLSNTGPEKRLVFHDLSSRFAQRVKQVTAAANPSKPGGEFHHFDASTLRPSFAATLISVSGPLIKPAFGVALLVGLFVTVAASPDSQTTTLGADLPATESPLDTLAGASPGDANELEIASLAPALRSESQQELRNRVSFIAGLIAVHRPSLKNSGEIAKYIVELSATEKISPFYIAAIISVESRFGAGERSPVGAMGLMQLMPNTAKHISTQSTGRRSYPVLSDPRTNIRLGIEYIKELEQRYQGNRTLALAAYNWGPGNIDKVRQGRARTPASVSRYASTVLERFLRWQAHYRSAEKHSEKMQTDALG